MDVQEKQVKIDEIISKRKEFLPKVAERITRINTKIQSIKTLLKMTEELLGKEKNVIVKSQINKSCKDLETLITSLEDQVNSLNILKIRFNRETVNIGVSGDARVGKSTTLQMLTGLTDIQIPAADGIPVTAVKSEIYNSTKEYTEITFRDQTSFINDHIKPHLDCINDKYGTNITISSIAELRSAKLPSCLGDNIDGTTSDSLLKLQQAQRSIDTYSDFLTGGTKRFSLEDIRKFAAYPSNDALKAEERGGIAAERAYLAVKEIKIYCQFPRLGNAKIGLIDLPGLGEIDDTVAKMHLRGLEDGIDQVFMVMRPLGPESFFKASISQNVDRLRKIQPGIKRRGDLITAGINIYSGHEGAAKTLRDDFERKVNNPQKSDIVEVKDYKANDSQSVAELFDYLLGKTSSSLPVMDQEVFDYFLAQKDTETEVASVLNELSHTLALVRKNIPLPEKFLNQQINAISAALIDDYNNYEVTLLDASNKESVLHREFNKDIEEIYKKAEDEIADGLFLGNSNWEVAARGKKDYYNYYRDEAKRVRRELISRYDELDVFYEGHVSELKLNAIDIFLRNTGNLRMVFDINRGETADEIIDKISTELAGSVKDEDLLSALAFLKKANFGFKNNVVLQISDQLANLENPTDPQDVKRTKLGSIGATDQKIVKLKEYLARDAHAANVGIRNALLKSNDRFNEYLSICMAFFNDYLYRKDDENFKHVVIRSLINEYKEYIITDETDYIIDQEKVSLIDRIKESVKAIQSDIRDSVVTKSHYINQSNNHKRTANSTGFDANQEKKTILKKLKKGMNLQGIVSGLANFGVFVDLGGIQGLVHKTELADEAVSNPSEVVEIGETVIVKVIDVDFDKLQVSLSMKQAA